MKATIFIPTFNAGAKFKQLLESLFSQSGAIAFEVLVIDSGSADSTKAIASGYPLRWMEIANKDFQHGRTRNLAAREARGEIVVYLTQSGRPVDQQWLARMLRHFEDPQVAAVYGRHEPWPGQNPLVEAAVNGAFRWISPQGTCVRDCLLANESWEALPAAERDRRRFFSNANSALRRDFLLAHPFPEVDYAEDQLMGVQILKAGKIKVYDPEAAIFHSHDFPLTIYFKRKFDEFMALRSIGQLAKAPSVAGSLYSALRALPGAWRSVWSSKDRHWSERLWWSLRAPWFIVAERVALYLGSRFERLPRHLVQLLSWENQQKAGPSK